MNDNYCVIPFAAGWMVDPYVGIFRPMDADTYLLTYKGRLPCNTTGSHTYCLDCPVSVKKGDVMAVFTSSKDQRSGIAVCRSDATECDNVIYEKVLVKPLYDHKLKIGTNYSFTDENVEYRYHQIGARLV